MLPPAGLIAGIWLLVRRSGHGIAAVLIAVAVGIGGLLLRGARSPAIRIHWLALRTRTPASPPADRSRESLFLSCGELEVTTKAGCRDRDGYEPERDRRLLDRAGHDGGNARRPARVVSPGAGGSSSCRRLVLDQLNYVNLVRGPAAWGCTNRVKPRSGRSQPRSTTRRTRRRACDEALESG